jgi:hypothetical protein
MLLVTYAHLLSLSNLNTGGDRLLDRPVKRRLGWQWPIDLQLESILLLQC